MDATRANTTVRTTCAYCGVGCGVLATPRADGSVDIAGDPEHPANFGRLCSKGSALGETLGLDGRLLHPRVGGRRVSWDAATELVAERFAHAIAEHGPNSVALYVSGQLLTEDYFVANKLMKGFIGSANIDTNSRLCMASAVAGHRRAFGADIVPGTYEDFEQADLVVLVGSNLAWCHPVLHQRLMAARDRIGTRLVVIDPRRTATAVDADLHLAIEPGSDVALFNGLFAYMSEVGAVDTGFVAAHTCGLEQALAEASGHVADVARLTGLDPSDVQAFFELFARTEKVVTAFSQGVNQSVSGTDKVNSIINCHLISGRIGKPGMGPFSVTGQPNAMGGREVGGLATQLAAHMDLEAAADRERLGRFWQTRSVADRPGLKAVDLFEAVRDGRIKALWIMATNPVASMPDADLVREALKACPFVVVSDILPDTDTAKCADVLLPAAGWGEKDGTVTNSERLISRQRAFLDLPGEARPDWWIITQIARRMGFTAAFPYSKPADIFAEHAALSSFENDGGRAFDIGGLAALDAAGYHELAPARWPFRRDASAQTRFGGDGRFFTPDGRARFVATPVAGPAREPRYPMVLNTGRVRDHWHTMTRTGRSPRLSRHIAEPFVEIHPLDAAQAGIGPADLVRVESPLGQIVVRALVAATQRQGTVFVPMHWNGQTASDARVDSLVIADTDPVSGQPALKSGRVRIARFPARWYGFAVTRSSPRTQDCDYWALARARAGYCAELAGLADPASWRDLFASLLGFTLAEDDVHALHDVQSGHHRLAAFSGDRLLGALFVAREPVAASRSFLAAALTERFETPQDRLALLAGRPRGDVPDTGALVCSCFEIGTNQIEALVRAGGAKSVDDVGAKLKAGTNCGSCRAEIRRIIHARSLENAN
ncbi:nitrate reductase [Amorphus orientalis]|uniref:Assimilatory nitrate reductase catalytic subunit n=1 Tax=Amorphus orientalis TaxID=649198 RepID=A0AAE3VT87_9HYPH|nr:nitrate reductase [Amorphus orientalis]MDQ0317493.1 assimilatory nitrate reductase catalytic subunit [Amorphus orientalis]